MTESDLHEPDAPSCSPGLLPPILIHHNFPSQQEQQFRYSKYYRKPFDSSESYDYHSFTSPDLLASSSLLDPGTSWQPEQNSLPFPPMQGCTERDDWVGNRERGRGHFVDENSIHRRSRSGWWDRNRERHGNLDQRERLDRREDERRPERDNRDRSPEPWKKDLPPARVVNGLRTWNTPSLDPFQNLSGLQQDQPQPENLDQPHLQPSQTHDHVAYTGSQSWLLDAYPLTKSQQDITGSCSPERHSFPPHKQQRNQLLKKYVRGYAISRLNEQGDEYILKSFDEDGEKKVDANGYLQGGREYRCRTFKVLHRGNKLFMLGSECARRLGYRDSYMFFKENSQLHKITATQQEKDDLIQQDILPYSYRSRAVGIVTARSIFRQFGSRIIVNGRRVRDDYWERKAKKQGFTEKELADPKRPGAVIARHDLAAGESGRGLFIQGENVCSNVSEATASAEKSIHSTAISADTIQTSAEAAPTLLKHEKTEHDLARERNRTFDSLERSLIAAVTSRYPASSRDSSQSVLNSMHNTEYVAKCDGRDETRKTNNPVAGLPSLLICDSGGAEYNSEMSQVQIVEPEKDNGFATQPDLNDFEDQDDSAPRSRFHDFPFPDPDPRHGPLYKSIQHIAPSVVAFTDSGYGSSIGRVHRESKNSACPHDAEDNKEGPKEDVCMVIPEEAADNSPMDDIDIESVYSEVSDIAKWNQEGYVSALTVELMKTISSYHSSADIMERLYDVLPELLKTFSLSLGHNASTQMHRDVMVFTHKYRHDVVAKLKEKLSGDEPFAEAPRQIPRFELVSRWLSSIDERLDPNMLDENPCGSSSEEVDSDSDLDSMPTPLATPAQSDTQSEVEGQQQDDEATTKLPGIPAYANFIRSSVAYSNLVANIHMQCRLAPVQPNIMKDIRETILEALPSYPFISRRKPTQTFSMVYKIHCDILAFVQSQDYNAAIEIAIRDAITLTGSSTKSQALTCSEYISQTWPSNGPYVLGLVRDAAVNGFKEDVFVLLPDGSRLEVFASNSKMSNFFYANIDGPAYCIAEIGEVLAWLGAALRSSTYPEKITYVRPCVRDIFRVPFHPSGFHCSIDFSERREGMADVNGQCWHNLFRNPVVVEGYPIPRRLDAALGIEMPLQMMATLTRTNRVNPFSGNLYLKGFSMILVPTECRDNLISWHLLCNKNGERISYLDGASISQVKIHIPQLESCRHILGWCTEIKFNAGAPDACYNIKGARLPRAHGNLPLADTFISMGQILTGGSALVVGKKDTPVHISRNGYVRKLKWISSKYMLFWDEEDKRGWLVNGVSALLHLVCASLEQDKQSGFQDVSLFKMSDIQWAKQSYQPKSALQVLLNQNNLQMRIYPEKNGYTKFQDHVEGHFDMLEKLIDHQQSVTGDDANMQTSRAYLEGWDFSDLATERDLIYPRMLALDAKGKSWLDFLRSINAITLFGRGFGDIIEPVNVCARWAKLPKGMWNIAVSQSDLQDIMDMDGNSDSRPVRLTDKLIWYTPETSSWLCQCKESDTTAHSDLTQIMLPSRTGQQLSAENLKNYSPGGGAFIFGYNTLHRWFWGDTGDPSSEQQEDTKSPLLRKWTRSITPDSGIGQSLPSTASRDSESTSVSSFRQTFGTECSEASQVPPSFSKSQRRRKRPCRRSTSPCIGRRNYTVGIVCALYLEMLAVRALFDSTHEEVPIEESDPNYYALGSISNHNVVAACLPDGEYGTRPAVEVASNMRRSFPDVRFCLLVGIGGGVPSLKNDIRLGDIVVSTPSGAGTGILPFDVKKTLISGEFQLNGYLQPPPRHLRCALSEIKSDPRLSKTPPLQAYQRQIENCNENYGHPGLANDKLFPASYPHHPAQDNMICCNACDVQRQLLRPPRESLQPYIHYGTIASGDQVMKDAQQRDELATKYDIVCFETEAAGIMNTFPSLVIRGICDYADSHKNKMWQRYAAASAAAFAKFFLSRVRKPQEVELEV